LLVGSGDRRGGNDDCHSEVRGSEPQDSVFSRELPRPRVACRDRIDGSKVVPRAATVA